MATRPDLRIGDADREAGAESLRENYAQGRLSLTEFNERLDAIFAATTQGQLDHITRDLPHVSAPSAPLPVTTGAYERGDRGQSGRGQNGSWQSGSRQHNSWQHNSWQGASGQGASGSRRAGTRARGPRHALSMVSGLVLVVAIWFLALSPTLLHLRFFPLPGRFGILLGGLLLIRSLFRRIFGRRR
jgi:Domain of unknown function (DUF1707)